MSIMADVVTIPQNLFYIIIAVIAVLGLIVGLMQWRRVRDGQSNFLFPELQADRRKIELVEKDLESQRVLENVFHFPENSKIDFQTFVKLRPNSCKSQVILTVK